MDAGEGWCDLAEVNGQVFVNNVSLGIYAEAVQKDEYREAKIKTLLDTVPQVLGPDAEVPGLDWTSPSAKNPHPDAAVLGSNTKARLGGVKAPKSVQFIDSIPRTAAGKMDKKALRTPHWGNSDRMVN